MPLMLEDLGPCPVCGAAVAVTGPLYRQHIAWHEATGTGSGPQPNPAHAGDDAPTQKFPPIRETVFRRPPPPAVRELRGAELLRALADELAREGEDLDDDEELMPAPAPCKWVNPDPAAAWPKTCEWPDDAPCRAYGSPGCGMKAQEQR